MGLAIYLITGLKKIEGARRDADTDELFLPDGSTIADGEYEKFYQDPYFENLNRHAGVELDAYYAIEDGVRVFGRSYGGYNVWRENLAKLAGYPLTDYEENWIKQCHAAGAWDVEEGPFHELIHFSDCEGTLGPVVCAKLAKDFEEFMSKAESDPEFEPYLEGYKQLAAACKRAGEENGALRFC